MSVVKIEGPMEAEALRILRDVPGVTVVGREVKHGDHRIDAMIHFAGTDRLIAVETKARANAATAWQLVHYADALAGTPLLLVADETTAQAREILQEHGIGVIDGRGNAHIELPGLLLHVEGGPRRRAAKGGTPPTRLRGKAGVAAQALLLHPERMWGVNELADEAKISAGLAHRVLARLEQEGIVVSEGSGPNRTRHLENPSAMLDLWAEEDEERAVRMPAYVLARTPEQLLKQLGARLAEGHIEYAITGAGAASVVAPLVTAVPVVEVWTSAHASEDELLEATRGEHVNDGENVVFLQPRDDAPLAFREKRDGVWVANRFRLYADLRRDPRRGREQADHLRREVIGFCSAPTTPITTRRRQPVASVRS